MLNQTLVIETITQLSNAFGVCPVSRETLLPLKRLAWTISKGNTKLRLTKAILTFILSKQTNLPQRATLLDTINNQRRILRTYVDSPTGKATLKALNAIPTVEEAAEFKVLENKVNSTAAPCRPMTVNELRVLHNIVTAVFALYPSQNEATFRATSIQLKAAYLESVALNGMGNTSAVSGNDAWNLAVSMIRDYYKCKDGAPGILHWVCEQGTAFEVTLLAAEVPTGLHINHPTLRAIVARHLAGMEGDDDMTEAEKQSLYRELALAGYALGYIIFNSWFKRQGEEYAGVAKRPWTVQDVKYMFLYKQTFPNATHVMIAQYLKRTSKSITRCFQNYRNANGKPLEAKDWVKPEDRLPLRSDGDVADYECEADSELV